MHRLAGKLHRALNRFGAGIGEEGSSHAGVLAQSCSDRFGQWMAKQIAEVDNLSDLVPQGRGHARVTVSKRIDRNPR